MNARKGTCTNYGNCSLADKREEITDPGDFLCPECEHALHELSSPSRGLSKYAILGGGIVAVVLAVVFLVKAPWSSNSPKPGADGPITNGPTPDHSSTGIGDCKLKPTAQPDVLRLLQYLKQGMNYASQKRYEQALAEFNQVLTIDPNFLSGKQNSGSALLALHKYLDAEKRLHEEIILDDCLQKLNDENLTKFAYMMEVGDSTTLSKDAARVNIYRERLRKVTAATHYNLAALYALQNKADASLDELRSAITHGFSDSQVLKSDPDLKNVRQLPAFKEVVALIR